MSTTTPPAVPYQAYRSKRHSRTASAVLAPNVPPPTLSRPASVISNGPIPASLSTQADIFDTEKVPTEYSTLVAVIHDKPPLLDLVPQPVKELPSPPSTDSLPLTPDSPHVDNKPHEPHDPTPVERDLSVAAKLPSMNGKSKQVESTSTSPISSPSCSSTPLPRVRESGSASSNASKKATTFRRLQPRPSAGRAPLPSSPLRPPEVQSRVPSASQSITRHFDRSPLPPKSPSLHSRVASISSVVSDDKPCPAAQSTGSSPSPSHISNSSAHIPPVTLAVPQSVPSPGILQPPARASSMLGPPQPPPKAVSLASTSLSIPPATSPPISNPPLPSVALRSSAPYIPGFQPKGVYRPRTDEFAAVRKVKSDANRVERTKLERRLEKLINLHFPVEDSGSEDVRKVATERRRSSLFELDFASLRNMDASEIWKGMVQSQALQGAKGDIRATEQRIAPWQEDSDVSKCPLCNSSFHPITNRKHHCRLCGQIICSLPVKRGQRPEPCSILFIVDSKTRKIEEVGEGVDYGVKRKGNGMSNGKMNGKGKGKQKEPDDALADDEKFLKGVRVCRSCKPILSREQFYQEVSRIPILLRLYEGFINVEKEIEEALPQFHDLLLTLSSDTAPTKEASAVRKRILEDFASYDALSKRIRKLPCPPGSSQDRVQLAISTRAELFLQKNMFPLQSIPKPKKQTSASDSDSAIPIVDPDSELAHALQPLLEQEALLESFIGEAMAHRKFEDAKTLKANLKEIRVEIDRMLENGAGGMEGVARVAG